MILEPPMRECGAKTEQGNEPGGEIDELGENTSILKSHFHFLTSGQWDGSGRVPVHLLAGVERRGGVWRSRAAEPPSPYHAIHGQPGWQQRGRSPKDLG